MSRISKSGPAQAVSLWSGPTLTRCSTRTGHLLLVILRVFVQLQLCSLAFSEIASVHKKESVLKTTYASTK